MEGNFVRIIQQLSAPIRRSRFRLNVLRAVSFLALSLFTTSSFLASPGKTDSLEHLLRLDKNDSMKVKHLQELSLEKRYDNYDSAVILCTEALTLSHNIRWYQGVGQSHRILGIIYDDHGDYDLALAEHKEAMNVWFMELTMLRGDDHKGKRVIISSIAACLSNIGVVYANKSDHSRALDYYVRALKIDELLEDQLGIAGDLSNIGLVYYSLGQYEKSLEFNDRALEITEKLGDEVNAAINLGNRGSLYVDLDQDSLAEICFVRALELSRKLNNKILMATWIGNLGTVYERKGQYDQATHYFSEALRMNREMEYKEGVVLNLGGLGSVLSTMGQYAEARILLEEQLSIAAEIGAPDLILDAHQNLNQLYEAEGAFAKALEHYTKYASLQDSLRNSDRNKEITKMELRYVYEKEKELEDAGRRREMAMLVKEGELSEYRKWLLGIFSLLILFLAVVVIFRQRLKNKRERESFELQKRLVQSALDKSRLEKENLELDVRRSVEKLHGTASLIQEKSRLMEMMQEELSSLKSKRQGQEISAEELFGVIRQNLDPEQYWTEFIANFNLVYKDFLKVLTARFPEITRNEIRLCVLLKCNLGNKEIANILHIGPDSVKKAHNRIRKKFNLLPKDSLKAFIQQLD